MPKQIQDSSVVASILERGFNSSMIAESSPLIASDTSSFRDINGWDVQYR